VTQTPTSAATPSASVAPPASSPPSAAVGTAFASQGADADVARVRALAAYNDFLTLRKDADPDIPILKEAKAEYAKLQ
jgi:hypothetical protein